MRNYGIGLAAVLLAAAGWAGSAEGAVVGGNATSTGDSFVFLSPPTNVGNDNFQNNSALFAFDERQSAILNSPLTVNITPGGGSGTIPAGTAVSSHYVFVDPDTTQTITGTVDFSDDILGIITEESDLDDSAFLGATATNYLSPGLLGLESTDTVSISSTDPQQVEVDFTASSPGDYVRVITVPEPASLALLLPGALLALRRRQ